jgi:hypothetical protein
MRKDELVAELPNAEGLIKVWIAVRRLRACLLCSVLDGRFDQNRYSAHVSPLRRTLELAITRREVNTSVLALKPNRTGLVPAFFWSARSKWSLRFLEFILKSRVPSDCSVASHDRG